MRAAVVQLNSKADVAANLEAAERLVRAAASEGAELVVLPEKWNALGDLELLRGAAETIEGDSIAAARAWARELGLALLAGSFAERREGRERLSNTSLLIDPDGEIAAVYRKIHMFDVDVEGTSYRESEGEEPGGEAVLCPVGALRLGLTVCYDVRFPELYRELAVAGANAFTVPSAFTEPTGRAHWEVLLRARAIENQAFVLAANQHGEAPPHHSSFGHSMIVDPWGRVLGAIEQGEGHVTRELDLAELERVRTELPSLAGRRPEAYRVAEPAISAGGGATGEGG